MDEEQQTMAENKLNPSAADTISREALGRVAEIGDLYDATTDRFCGISMFREHFTRNSPAIFVTGNHLSQISTSISSSLTDKLHVLDVTADLSLSVLAGFIKLDGAAKYLNEKKISFKSVECALLYSIKTVVEKLNMWHEEAKKLVYVDALTYPRATHVVVQIDWGANCIIRVTDHNNEDKGKTEVKRNLMAKMNKLKGILSVTGNTEVVMTEAEKENWRKFSLEIFGDVLLDSSGKDPTTIDGALEMIRNLPQLIQKSNDGKGKPLTYVMFPLSSPLLRKYFGVKQSINQAQKEIVNAQIGDVFRIFHDLSEYTQKAHDHFEKIKNYRDYLTASELQQARLHLRTVEDQESRLSSDLDKALKAVRSGNNDAECLTNVCHRHLTTADETFQRFEKICYTIFDQIVLAKRCQKYDAKYLTPQVYEEIESACDDYENVYVLFDGEADREATQRNHSAFIELARNHQNNSSTACYVTRLDQSEDARIKYYRKGKLLCADVAKELEVKDMAKRLDVARPALRLQPFRVRCPGSFDGDCSREERSWTCFMCYEALQFCPDDAALYCSCGKSTANQFQFRCRSDAHGSHFMPCSSEILQRVARHYAALDYKGD